MRFVEPDALPTASCAISHDFERDTNAAPRRRCNAVDEIPAQPVRCCVRDHHPDALAGRHRFRTRLREVHQLVLSGATRPHRQVLLRRTFDEHFLAPIDTSLMAAQRARLDDVDQPLHAFAYNVGIDEVVDHLRCFGSRPG